MPKFNRSRKQESLFPRTETSQDASQPRHAGYPTYLAPARTSPSARCEYFDNGNLQLACQVVNDLTNPHYAHLHNWAGHVIRRLRPEWF